MPFARHVSSVACILQQSGHSHHVVAQHALVMGVDPLLRRDEFRDIRHPGQVTVDPGQQHGPRWGTVGRRVVIAEADALIRQGVECRRVDLAAVGRQIGEAHIIGQDQHDVRTRGLVGVMRNYRASAAVLHRRCGSGQGTRQHCGAGKVQKPLQHGIVSPQPDVGKRTKTAGP